MLEFSNEQSRCLPLTPCCPTGHVLQADMSLRDQHSQSLQLHSFLQTTTSKALVGVQDQHVKALFKRSRLGFALQV